MQGGGEMVAAVVTRVMTNERWMGNGDDEG